LLISILLGMIGALAKLSRSRIARSIAGVYTTVIRGIPDLVLMTLIFFGGQIVVNNIGEKLGWDYIDVNPFIAGVITIGFIFGAYMAESFRGGILAVSRGEIEAGYAFGMTPLKVFLRITLPAMVRHALPSFGNNWLVLTKATALVSVIGLQDLVYNASVAGGSTRKPFTFFLTAAFLYLIITGVSDIGVRWLDRRYSVGVRRA
jgi:His/Glu/Gln/Arg/opine family amino acid ABC transporter permease subunit